MPSYLRFLMLAPDPAPAAGGTPAANAPDPAPAAGAAGGDVAASHGLEDLAPPDDVFASAPELAAADPAAPDDAATKPAAAPEPAKPAATKPAAAPEPAKPAVTKPAAALEPAAPPSYFTEFTERVAGAFSQIEQRLAALPRVDVARDVAAVLDQRRAAAEEQAQMAQLLETAPPEMRGPLGAIFDKLGKLTKAQETTERDRTELRQHAETTALQSLSTQAANAFTGAFAKHFEAMGNPLAFEPAEQQAYSQIVGALLQAHVLHPDRVGELTKYMVPRRAYDGAVAALVKERDELARQLEEMKPRSAANTRRAADVNALRSSGAGARPSGGAGGDDDGPPKPGAPREKVLAWLRRQAGAAAA